MRALARPTPRSSLWLWTQPVGDSAFRTPFEADRGDFGLTFHPCLSPMGAGSGLYYISMGCMQPCSPAGPRPAVPQCHVCASTGAVSSAHPALLPRGHPNGARGLRAGPQRLVQLLPWPGTELSQHSGLWPEPTQPGVSHCLSQGRRHTGEVRELTRALIPAPLLWPRANHNLLPPFTKSGIRMAALLGPALWRLHWPGTRRQQGSPTMLGANLP